MFEVEPAEGPCGATIHGLDLRTLNPDVAEQVRATWLEHLVVSFPDQRLTLDEFERVAQLFGPFGVDPYLRGLDDHPHVAEIRREADESAPIFAEGWHSDWTFLASPPAATLLYARVIPPVGGDTLYSDQHAAYDALSDAMKERLAGLNGIHSARRGYSKAGAYGAKDVGRSMAIISSDDALATQLHPIVRRHPETGRPALFVSPAYVIGIDAMDNDEAQTLLAELFAHQGAAPFVHRHRWAPGTLTMWDNRAVIHSATGGYQGHSRLLQRITIAERS